LLLAAESLRQKIGGPNIESSNYVTRNRTINSGLAGYTANIGNHRMQLNARRDNNSQFGNKTTGGAAYGYQITNELRVRGGYSTGFRAPTFMDLYFPAPWGNPDLKPETSRNQEVGLSYDTANTRLSVTAYRNVIDNLIILNASWQPINVDGRAKISGATFAGQHNFGNITVRASYDALSPKDSNGNYLQRRARQHGSVGFDHSWQRLTWGADAIAMGRRYDNAANTIELRGFATMNLRAEYRMNNELSLFARVNNVFNKDYMMTNTWVMPGINAFVGLRYAMR
jgi:vitamin B12 transporter